MSFLFWFWFQPIHNAHWWVGKQKLSTKYLQIHYKENLVSSTRAMFQKYDNLVSLICRAASVGTCLKTLQFGVLNNWILSLFWRSWKVCEIILRSAKKIHVTAQSSLQNNVHTVWTLHWVTSNINHDLFCLQPMLGRMVFQPEWTEGFGVTWSALDTCD